MARTGELGKRADTFARVRSFALRPSRPLRSFRMGKPKVDVLVGQEKNLTFSVD